MYIDGRINGIAVGHNSYNSVANIIGDNAKCLL